MCGGECSCILLACHRTIACLEGLDTSLTACYTLYHTLRKLRVCASDERFFASFQQRYKTVCGVGSPQIGSLQILLTLRDVPLHCRSRSVQRPLHIVTCESNSYSRLQSCTAQGSCFQACVRCNVDSSMHSQLLNDHVHNAQPETLCIYTRVQVLHR